jgi:tetratricopeptide (TPR) repeat protein
LPESIQRSLIEAFLVHKAGCLDEAEALYRGIVARQPDHAEAWHLLGAVAQQRGGHAAAARRMDRAIRLEAGRAVYHFNRGIVLNELGRSEEALASFETALRLDRYHVASYFNRGTALRRLGRLDQACASFGAALCLQPDYGDAYSHRGTTLTDLGRYEEALASFEITLRIKPDHAEGQSNRGTLLNTLGFVEAGLASLDKAVCLEPDYAEAYLNRATALNDLGRPDETVACFERAIEVRPDYADAHCMLALIRLMAGDFEAGWRGHEWRKRSAADSARSGAFPAPMWDGDDLNGRVILLHDEQGFGDTLQFCRYAPLVAARGGRVILRAQRPLRRLLSSLDGVEQVLAEDDPLPSFDLHCALMSLPFLFGTRVETIPAQIPYLRPDEDARTRWAGRLGEGKALRVGLVWAGNPKHRNDRKRSMPFSALAPLWRLAGIRWYSLQLGQRRADLAAAPSGLIEDLSPHLGDFSDSAAVLSQLDLLLTVDTSAAHLAGACGCAAWVMLPSVAEWRWLRERSDSPWYPSLRLFRETERGIWNNVVTDVAQALLRRIRA